MAAGLPPRRIHYRALADTLDAWMRARLWAQVMAGLVFGVGIGLALSEDAGLVNPALSAALGEWLALPGQQFLSMVKMVLMPLVACSIILGLAAGASDPAKLRRVGGRLALFVVGASTLAATRGRRAYPSLSCPA